MRGVSAEPGRPSRLRAIPAALVLAGMMSAAVVELEKLPQGFSPSSLRFVSNTFVPWSILGLAPVTLGIALVVGRVRPLTTFLVAAGTLCVAAGVTARVCFPVSAPPFDMVVGGAGLAPLLAAACYRRWLAHWTTLFGLAMGALLGVAVMAGERAPDASTHPALDALPAPLGGQGASPDLPEGRFDISEGSLHLRRGEVGVDVFPVLMFISRSPDRAWTVLAPPRVNASTTRWQWAMTDGETMEVALASDALTHRVRLRPASSYELTSFSRLDHAVFTHLNRFAEVRFDARDAALRIGDCDHDVEVRPCDYPEGRPTRFAYFDGTSLRVVEATTVRRDHSARSAISPIRGGMRCASA